jgi:hypothetical protein
MRAAVRLVVWGVAFGLAGCGGNKEATGNASVIMGPSTVTRNVRAGGGSGRVGCPADGNWFLTPDQGKVTFKSLTFVMSDGNSRNIPLNGCTATYDRAKASGAKLLDCPVTVPVGTINEVWAVYGTSFDIKIADATNCIYTNPSQASGFSATAGGNDFATFTVTAQEANGDFYGKTILSTPKVVAEGDAPTLSITTDMIHTMFTTAASGAMTYAGSSPSPLVSVHVDFGEGGKSEYYTSASTIENLNVASDTSEGSVFRVVYNSAGDPTFLEAGAIGGCIMGDYPTQAANANPAVSPVNSANGYKAGGYLGLDPAVGAHGTLAFALPVDFTYAAYRSLVTFPRATTIGDTSPAKCQFLNGLTAAPVPISGNTYASGAPSIATPDGTATVTLRAN